MLNELGEGPTGNPETLFVGAEQHDATSWWDEMCCTYMLPVIMAVGDLSGGWVCAVGKLPNHVRILPKLPLSPHQM
jgi:hypothetical protein